MSVDIGMVGPEAADDVLHVIHAGFGARPRLNPPGTAMDETVESIEQALTDGDGVLVMIDGHPAATLLVRHEGHVAVLTRVSVDPERQFAGVAMRMVAFVEQVLAERGVRAVRINARPELPATIRFWEKNAYVEVGRDGVHMQMSKVLPVTYDLPTVDVTRELGRRLAPRLRAGDVLILTGELGAGKTTFTQGLGEGLDVRGDVTSPTFVISRVHRSNRGGPLLTHVDAYRLGDGAELDDLDLDAYVDAGVTVVEWGEGIAERLAGDRLHIHLGRSRGEAHEPDLADGDDPRIATLTPVGLRWFDIDLTSLLPS